MVIFSYLHTCYIRSYRYGPPLFIYMLLILFVYSIVPNPVMESYAFSAALLFVVAAAIGYSVIDIEAPNQEAITVLHTGSLIRLYVVKLLYSWAFTLPLAAYAVLYPALFNRFDRDPSVEELIVSFLYHASLSWLGVVIACWFNAKFIPSRVMAFLTLCLVLALSFSTLGLEKLLPGGLQPITILLPPVKGIIHVLSNYEGATAGVKLFTALGTMVYGIILSILFMVVMHMRKLDNSSSEG